MVKEEFDFLEYFYTDEFDNEIAIKGNDFELKVIDFKKYVYSNMLLINKLPQENVVIGAIDNFSFIVLFLASIFANKNIYIVNSNNQKETIDNSVILSEIIEPQDINLSFNKIDYENVNITLYSSGTTSKPKLINKDLTCIFNEVNDIISAFNLDKSYELITSAPLNHMFVITCYIFLPLALKCPVNVSKINYPDDLKIENSLFITSPSFLELIEKYNHIPKIAPKLILSAGAKLNKTTHGYFEKFTKIANIYGCTETGVLAYNLDSSKDDLTLFSGIKIIDDKTTVKSNYAKPKEVILDDKIILNSDNSIKVLGRTDRLFKIQEKRVSAKALEDEIIKNQFIKNICLIDLDDKIGAIAELNQKGSDFLIKNGVVELNKAIQNDLSEKFNIIPKKWKYIDKIPKNQMGKYDIAKIKELFNLNLSLPYVVERKTDSQSAQFDLYFYKNCNFFKGHFDKYPIVPGVVQVFFASYFALNSFDELENTYTGQLKRIKFSNIIKPDTIIRLKLSKKDKTVDFSYLSQDEKISYSQGTLPVQNIYKGVDIL